MARVYNFSAGPAVLPKEVLAQAQAEMLDWQGSGMSVMEMSHRGKEFSVIFEQTKADLIDLLQVPEDYCVLFLQGGASLQFSMVPLNLLAGAKNADYVDTGIWSQKAIEEALRYGKVNVVASGADRNYSYVPEQSSWRLSPDAAYVHYTSNETAGGVEFFWIPDSGDVPLVADMSSNILSKPLDIARYGLIYAGAQKNIGSAGLTIVVIRHDLLGKVRPGTPLLLDYQLHADHDSMYHTPPTYGIYIAGLVFQWIKRQGGVAAMEAINRVKSDLLYRYLDATDFYTCRTAVESRSRMNIPFYLRDERLNDLFLQGAEQNGLLQLKGHRSVGGMRASMYNAMPVEGVQALVSYMQTFEQQHG